MLEFFLTARACLLWISLRSFCPSGKSHVQTWMRTGAKIRATSVSATLQVLHYRFIFRNPEQIYGISMNCTKFSPYPFIHKLCSANQELGLKFGVFTFKIWWVWFYQWGWREPLTSYIDLHVSCPITDC